MISLKDAIETGKLDQFIAEHPEVQGDEVAFNRAVQAMAQTSKEARPASQKGGSDD
jgi:hypothetical protein